MSETTQPDSPAENPRRLFFDRLNEVHDYMRGIVLDIQVRGWFYANELESRLHVTSVLTHRCFLASLRLQPSENTDLIVGIKKVSDLLNQMIGQYCKRDTFIEADAKPLPLKITT